MQRIHSACMYFHLSHVLTKSQRKKYHIFLQYILIAQGTLRSPRTHAVSTVQPCWALAVCSN